MFKTILISTFLCLCLKSKCQSTFICQSNGIYFKIDLNDLKNKNQKKKEVSVVIEIINYDTKDKYLAASDSGSLKKIKTIFSETSKNANLLTLFIGTCNEEMFPYHCKSDSFVLKKIASKEKIVCKYTFTASKPISSYLKTDRINFVFRYIDSDNFFSDQKKMFYMDYLRDSKKVFFSFNSDTYSKSIENRKD